MGVPRRRAAWFRRDAGRVPGRLRGTIPAEAADDLIVAPTVTGVDPHAAYDRDMARRKRWAGWWRRLGQVTAYVIGLVLAVALAVLLVVSVIDLGKPRIWGTFTETGCETRPRGGCRPLGVWVSDDRAIVVRDVYLNGWTEEDGTTRASYQPVTLLSGESNDVVDTPLFTGAGPWVIGVMLLWWVGYMLYKAASWGDIRLPPTLGHLVRRRSQTGRASLRRDYRRSLESSTTAQSAADATPRDGRGETAPRPGTTALDVSRE